MITLKAGRGDQLGTSGTEEWQYKFSESLYYFSYTPRLGTGEEERKGGGREDRENKAQKRHNGESQALFHNWDPSNCPTSQQQPTRQTWTIQASTSQPDLTAVWSTSTRRPQAIRVPFWNQGNVGRGLPSPGAIAKLQNTTAPTPRLRP